MTPLDLLAGIVLPVLLSLCISAALSARALQSIARGDWLDRSLKASPFGFPRPDVESLLKPTISTSTAPGAGQLAVEAARMIAGPHTSDHLVYEAELEFTRRPELVTILPLVEALAHRTAWTRLELWSNRWILLEYRKEWGYQAEQYAVEIHDALTHGSVAKPTIAEALG